MITRVGDTVETFTGHYGKVIKRQYVPHLRRVHITIKSGGLVWYVPEFTVTSIYTTKYRGG